jgi:hypothetical protein
MLSWGIPQGQWPQPSSATLLASSSLYLQIRDGTRAPLESRCNTLALCKVFLSTIYQAVLALICVPPALVVCDVKLLTPSWYVGAAPPRGGGGGGGVEVVKVWPPAGSGPPPPPPGM